MGEQHRAIRHRDHIVVEGPRRNRRFRLAHQQRPLRGKGVAPGHRRAGLAMLARRKRPARLAINKHLKARRIVADRQPHVIGRTLVAKGRGHRAVHREGRVGESQLQLRQRAGPFVAAVRHGDKVGDRKVAAPVGAVRRGADRRRIRRPHRGGRQGIGQQRGIGRGRIGAQLAQPAPVGPIVRQQHALRQPQRQASAHLGHALQGRLTRKGGLAGIAGGGQIAKTQPGKIMAGAHDAVEIDFLQHDLLPVFTVTYRAA